MKFENREPRRVEKEPREPIPTKVILEFFRHGTKQPGQEPTIRITPESRAEAEAKGKALNPQNKVSLGWSSPRERTRETTAHIMLTKELTPEMELEEVNDLIAQNQAVGDKIKTSPLLDFHINPETHYGQAARESFKEGKFLQFLAHDSDIIAIATRNKEESTSSRLAGQIAQIIKRYLKIGQTFNRLANKKPDKYQSTGYQLERYLGTHQGVGESFVFQVLHRMSWEEAENLIKLLNKSGFDELQGFRVEIINQPDQTQIIRLSLTAKNQRLSYDLTPEIIDDIIIQDKEFREAAAE